MVSLCLSLFDSVLIGNRKRKIELIAETRELPISSLLFSISRPSRAFIQFRKPTK